MKISERSKRLAGILEPEIAPFIHEHRTPEHIGFLTVTAVEVSGDLQVVDIFVTSLNGPRNFLKKLKNLQVPLARHLKLKLSLKQLLTVRFKPDKSVEHVEKMKNLLG